MRTEREFAPKDPKDSKDSKDSKDYKDPKDPSLKTKPGQNKRLQKSLNTKQYTRICHS